MQPRSSDPRYDLWRWAKRRALQQDLPFTLAVEHIDWPTHCPVLGLRLVKGRGTQQDASPTLDRLDPCLGYVPGNVQVISSKANRIKSDASLADLIRVTAYLQQIKD